MVFTRVLRFNIFVDIRMTLPTAGQRQPDTLLVILDANCAKEHENVRLDSDVALPRSE